MKPSLLQAGFELVRRENLEVTDDVSIIEALGQPVKLTQGSYTNIKACPFYPRLCPQTLKSAMLAPERSCLSNIQFSRAGFANLNR